MHRLTTTCYLLYQNRMIILVQQEINVDTIYCTISERILIEIDLRIHIY
jgi:hypothetical protein